MNNKYVFITILIILLFSLLFILFIKQPDEYIANTSPENVSSLIEPSQEVMDFIDYYSTWIDFDHPYVTCIFNKTCNGTFILGMRANLTENETEIKDFLNQYGEISRIITFSDHYSINFETDNLYKIDSILNSSKFNDLVLFRVESDYAIDSEEELTSCELDEDCVPVPAGCCGCTAGGKNTLINKKYLDEWESYQNVACYATGCAMVMSGDWTCVGLTASKCINNQCKFLNYTEASCDTPAYKLCKEFIPKSSWIGCSSLIEDSESYITCIVNSPSTFSDGIGCDGIVGLCENNKSKEEVLEMCRSNILIPEDCIAGEVVVYFDNNATEDEINDFINNSELKIKRILTDYFYEIRDSYSGVYFYDPNKENKAWELGGKPAQDFSDYLESFPEVHNVSFDYNYASSLIVVHFNGSISLETSEELIKSYEKFDDFDSLQLRDAEKVGIVTVPEGDEIEWVCKLREENILYGSWFRTSEIPLKSDEYFEMLMKLSKPY